MRGKKAAFKPPMKESERLLRNAKQTISRLDRKVDKQYNYILDLNSQFENRKSEIDTLQNTILQLNAKLKIRENDLKSLQDQFNATAEHRIQTEAMYKSFYEGILGNVNIMQKAVNNI